MKELFLEIKKILAALPDPYDSTKKMFRTVKLDKGQFERSISNYDNNELPHAYPAVFIHFTDVSYLVSQNRLGEGRGTMRVRFILNRLNDQDDEYETEIFDYAEYVNAAIQDAKDYSDTIMDKCTLQYFDMPTASNQLQPCWLDYGVSFTDSSGDKYRDWVKRKITTPQFTNRSDVEGETRPDIPASENEGQVGMVDSVDKIDEYINTLQ